ncbi:MAG: YqeG family HAD IIIA-type phosphatase [Cyanobacteria bacterium J06636_16]
MKRQPLPKRVPLLSEISLEALVAAGIQGIILDLDNTIVSEDDRYLAPRAEDWILAAKQQGIVFFLLSNGKRAHRVQYWSKHLDIPAISPARKPFPRSFRKALQHMSLTPRQAIVIGDGLHTDIVGAWFCGCASIQVASLPHPPRWWERILGRWVQVAYPSRQEIWPFKCPY